MGAPSLTQKVPDFTGSSIFWKVEWGGAHDSGGELATSMFLHVV